MSTKRDSQFTPIIQPTLIIEKPASSSPLATIQNHHPRRNSSFVIKSLSIIVSLTILVLIINYYLISNCPSKDESNRSGVLLNSLHGNDNNEKKLTISVYYEVLCPDSKHFILNQLQPVYKKFGGDLIDLRFVPFGKASFVSGEGGEYQFTCQHGPPECHGNKLHSCIISSLNDTKTALEIISCSMGSYKLWGSSIESVTSVTTDCIKKFVPADSPLMNEAGLCKNASNLLAAHGRETLNLNPSASFIPTIGVDGSLSNQRVLLRDLDAVVCTKLKKTRHSLNC